MLFVFLVNNALPMPQVNINQIHSPYSKYSYKYKYLHIHHTRTQYSPMQYTSIHTHTFYFYGQIECK